MSFLLNPFTGNFDEVSDLTTTTVGSTPNANASTVVESGTSIALTLQPADATNPGVLTAGTQTIGGNKTFTGSITASNLVGMNSGDTSVTFQPGGTASGNTYTSWAALYASLANVRGSAVDICFDNTFLPITIPAGTYDLTNVTFQAPLGKSLSSPVTVTLANGCVFTGFPGITALVTVISNSSAPIFSVPSGSSGYLIALEFAGSIGVGSGVPMISVPTGQTLFLILLSDSSVQGASGFPIIDLVGTAVLVVLLAEGVTFGSDTVSGSVSSTIEFIVENPNVNLDISQPLFLGTFVPISYQPNISNITIGSGLGDLVYSNATGQGVTLSANITTTPLYLSETGTGAAGNAPTWSTLIGTLTGHATLDLALTGGTMSGAINMGSHQINSLTDPTLAQDAATKNYVDLAVAALNPAAAVYAATTGSNIVGTYLNGASGVGATLTTTATGTFTIDGVTPPLHARILIKDQTSGFQNGIYDITTLGTTGVSTVFTRSADYNTAADMNTAGLIPVINGTLNGLSSWQQVANIVTVGTTSLVFTEFTANPSLYLLKANNLSDVASKTTSFNNLSPMTTAGDIIYENATPSGTRLAIGSTDNILKVSGGLPAWGSLNLASANAVGASILPVANGGTGQATLTNHGVLVGAGTGNVTQLAAAAAGTVLVGNGATSDPSFTATHTLGVNGTTAGTLSLATSTGSGASVTIQNTSTTTAWNFNLPTTAGSAGQVLTSQGGGSNAMTWTTGSGGTITAWSNSGTNTITATTANPTKGTTSTDKLWFRKVGGSAEVRIEYVQTGAGANGSGDYVFAMPAGVTIDTTLITPFATVIGGGAPVISNTVGCGICIINAAASGNAEIIVYDSTHVRFFVAGSGSPGGSLFSLGNTSVSFTAFFTVPIL